MTHFKLILSSLDLSDSLLACSEDCGKYSICSAWRFQFPSLSSPPLVTAENIIPKALSYKGECQ